MRKIVIGICASSIVLVLVLVGYLQLPSVRVDASVPATAANTQKGQGLKNGRVVKTPSNHASRVDSHRVQPADVSVQTGQVLSVILDISTNVEFMAAQKGMMDAMGMIMDDMTSADKAGRAPTMREKYAALIDSLGLSKEASKKFLALLKKGQDPKSQEEMRALLGDEGYATYKEYERTLPTRLFVDDLAIRLLEADCPLTASQAKALLVLDPEVTRGIPLSYNPGMTSLTNPDELTAGFDKTIADTDGTLTEIQKGVMDQYLGERFQAKEKAANAVNGLKSQVLSMLPPDAIKSANVRVMIGNNGFTITTDGSSVSTREEISIELIVEQ
jgi:hypothetical protein